MSATKNNSNKVRNPYHDHPMMKKGGVHQKTNKAKRHLLKMEDQRDYKKTFQNDV